jgi:16S rRNA (guanine527-N7)-methyltransferase
MSIQSDLEAYAVLLKKWNVAQNLVSRETLAADVWHRHINDSLQLAENVPGTALHIVDIGSGGGLPAIPLAIASRETERRFTLLEPVKKKAAFLRTVARELKLPVTVHAVRAEDFDSRETADVVTARAVAALPVLLGYVVRFMGPESHALLHKGKDFRRELDEAAQLFDFTVLELPSRTDAGGVILDISDLRAKSAR